MKNSHWVLIFFYQIKKNNHFILFFDEYLLDVVYIITSSWIQI